MNLYLRLILVFLRGIFGARLHPAEDASSLTMHVWPNDLDLNGHMNNGRFLSVMDLGRTDFSLRSGLLRQMLRQKNIPMLSAVKIRYRLPLMPFQKFRLETRVLCWDHKWAYMEQRFIYAKGPRTGVVAAIALVKGGFYDKRAGTMVPVADMLAAMDMDVPSPPMPEHVARWLEAEDALRRTTAPGAA